MLQHSEANVGKAFWPTVSAKPKLKRKLKYVGKPHRGQWY
jgi:hypothetical protein